MVLGQMYPIKVVKNLKCENNHPVHGWCDESEKTISIDSEEMGDSFDSTLIHEIGHAVFNESAIDQTSVPDDVKEIMVEQFAKVITKAFSLKPKGK